MSHNQLTPKERYHIYQLFKQSCTVRVIARSLGRVSSTVSREIRRNGSMVGRPPHYLPASPNHYDDIQAQKKAKERRKGIGPRRISEAVKEAVITHLDLGHSPEQIAAVLGQQALGVSHTWIYAYIRKDRKQGGQLFRSLRHQGKKRRRRTVKDWRGSIPYRVSISQRPQSANRRSRFGHWEADTIISRKSKAVLLALVERRSRLLKLTRLPNRKAVMVAQAICRLLKGHNVLSITSDNGKEFAAHLSLSKKLKAPFFFADPYSAWQRGSVENAIGLVRNFIPKNDDLKRHSHLRIATIQNNINSRPMKLHLWKSRSHVYSNSMCCV